MIRKKTISLALTCCCFIYSFANSKVQAQEEILHSHERMKRCKAHNYESNPLEAKDYVRRLNAVMGVLVANKIGDIAEDTAQNGDLGLSVVIDLAATNEQLAFLQKLKWFPVMRDKDTLKKRREEYICYMTANEVGQFIIREILRYESNYSYVGMYIKSKRPKRVFFAVVAEEDDKVEIKFSYWIKD